MPEMEKKRVAIVGSGCAGLGALWALKGTNHDVHLFEADDTLGGHTNTARFKYGNGKEKEVNVDTGFIVYNMATYRQSFPPLHRCCGTDKDHEPELTSG